MACMAALILLPYAARLGCLAAASLLSASWLYAARNLLTGAPRLAAALPCVILHCAAPWLLFHRVPPRGTPSPSEPSPEIITIGLAEFALVWLSNFKVRCCGKSCVSLHLAVARLQAHMQCACAYAFWPVQQAPTSSDHAQIVCLPANTCRSWLGCATEGPWYDPGAGCSSRPSCWLPSAPH